jgi:glucose uptake protein GlcU
VIGLIFGALVLDMWSAETSPKALIGIGWTTLLLVGLFFTDKNEKK